MKRFNLRKHMFLKLSQDEIINIDGINYHEVDDELIEYKKRKHFPEYNIEFVEGNSYHNAYGKYIVDEIYNNDRMKVRYEQITGLGGLNVGDIMIYPMKSQAQVIKNELLRNEKHINKLMGGDLIKFKGSNEIRLLGVIAMNGYISAEIGPRYHDRFHEIFEHVTGENPEAYKGKGYQLSDNDARWSYTLRIQLPVFESEKLNLLDFPKNTNIRGAGIDINNNIFVWSLFEKGYRPGKNNHRIDQLRTNFDGIEILAFDEGVQL